jgi:hypothetical protein
MIKIEINQHDEGSDSVDPVKEKHVIERSHWGGEPIGADVTCDILVKMFINLLQGSGYLTSSIIDSMENEIEELEGE